MTTVKVFGVAAGLFFVATSPRAGQILEKGFFFGSIEGEQNHRWVLTDASVTA